MKPINVVVPVSLEPGDASVPLFIKIDIQNLPVEKDPETLISLVDETGKLRKFEQIQAEYARKAIRKTGNQIRAEKHSGVTRQTLAKWAALPKK